MHTNTKPEDRLFLQWMNQVDFDLDAALGVGSRDLADAPYRDYFDAGLSAREAADEVAADNIEADDGDSFIRSLPHYSAPIQAGSSPSEPLS